MPGQETRSPDDFELFLEGILEAPRGQREVWQNHHYVPAFKNSPTAAQFPCGLDGRCGTGACAGQCAGQPAALVGGPAAPLPPAADPVRPPAGPPIDAAIPPLGEGGPVGVPAAGESRPLPEVVPVLPDQQPPVILPPSVPSGDGTRDQ
jgi:pilus assembly protein CpaC